MRAHKLCHLVLPKLAAAKKALNLPACDTGLTEPGIEVLECAMLQILQLLRVLGAGNAEASDQMSDILAQVASLLG